MSFDRSIDVVRQFRAHLESLRAAGVQFVPRVALAPLRVAANQAVTHQEEIHVATPPDVTPSLFEATPDAVPDSPDSRRHALDLLATEISTCDKCPELFSTRTQTVFGVGRIDPDVAFVGEAPGGDEDRIGEPFVGKAGQLLTRIINACGFKREEVYIFNILKCRPPGAVGSGSANRQPTAEECGNCRPFFDRQFDLVRPKYLVALGATAAKNLLETSTGIGKLRGKVYQFRGVPLICTFHPSAILRDDTDKTRRDVWEDMKLLLRTMGRPIPEVKKG
jgi:uracil-DNA glycosylase